MKQRHTLNTSLATSLICVATGIATHAQTTWEPLLPSPDTAASSGGYSVLIDPFPNPSSFSVFVGCDTPSGTPSVLRLTSPDSSFSSFTVEGVDSSLAAAERLASNPGDGLYAAGFVMNDANPRNPVGIWKVRKSPAASEGSANAWSDDDQFSLSSSAVSLATGITTDTPGNVYVAGLAESGSSPHWVVRRKHPGGGWTTVFDVKGQDAFMHPAMCFFPGNAKNSKPAVFTASDLNSKWTVFRSQNLGTNWASVDSWPNDKSPAAAFDAACDSQNGNIYVVGTRGLNAQNPRAWVIRTSDDGGDTWSTLLDVTLTNSWAFNVAIDAAGNVSVSGVVNPTMATPLWMIIRCTNPQTQSPAAWATSYANGFIPFGNNTYSKGRGIAADPAGNLFVTGFVVDWTDTMTTTPIFFSGSRVGLLRLTP
jgi:hypothetical protein